PCPPDGVKPSNTSRVHLDAGLAPAVPGPLTPDPGCNVEDSSATASGKIRAGSVPDNVGINCRPLSHGRRVARYHPRRPRLVAPEDELTGVVMAEYDKPIPFPDPFVGKPYWDGGKEGKLMLPRCTSCSKTHFYPRSMC